MKLRLTPTAAKAFINAPPRVQKTFLKQARFLIQNLHHPSLRAKKYDETKDIWQARVNLDWRFYFTIAEDSYVIQDIVPHPK